MNIRVLKRIEALENNIKMAIVPDLIIISFDETKEQWKIREQYIKDNDSEDKVKYMDDYKNYTVVKEFEGVILIDTLSAPESVVNGIQDSEPIFKGFNTTIISYAKN